MRRVVLASASPARLALLRAAGLDPDVVVSGVDETLEDWRDVGHATEVLARRKAEAVAAGQDDALVLGCDSMLELDGEALGKPGSAAEAVDRWRRMRGRSGVLHTGHAVVDTASGRTAEGVASTVVHFAHLDDDEIEAYVATGEPLNVAGAFTIDGLGGPFVRSLSGDWSAVVGLSLPLLRCLLGELEVTWPSLWRLPMSSVTPAST